MAPQETYQPPPPSDATMKAVRFHGKNDLRYEEIPVPKVGKGQVKLRPAWVGICGSGLYAQRITMHALTTFRRSPRVSRRTESVPNNAASDYQGNSSLDFRARIQRSH